MAGEDEDFKREMDALFGPADPLPEQKIIYLDIPLSEFEFLHDEIKRLGEGWSNAEAQIAVLRDALNHANIELTHRVGWEERMRKIQALVDEQAEDDALWLLEPTIAEAYLQQELRRLHEVIETP